MTPARFPHSDTPGSTLGCQLPRAYRRLLRPSSALDAKASTMCPSQLVTHTTNPTPPTNKNQAATTHTNPGSNHQQMGPDRRCTQHATKEPAHTRTITRHAPYNKKQKQKETHHSPALNTQERGGCISRCSRPLSRSQTTTPHHPAPTQGKPGRPGSWYRSPRRLKRLILQNPNSVSSTKPHDFSTCPNSTRATTRTTHAACARAAVTVCECSLERR